MTENFAIEESARKVLSLCGTAPRSSRRTTRYVSMEPWSEQMTREFFIYKYVTWPLGSWPVKRNENFARLRTSVVCVLEITMLINLGIDLAETSLENMDIAIDRFILMCSCTLCMVKVLQLRKHRAYVSRILENATLDWSSVVLQQYRQIMLGYTNLSRFIFIMQIIFSYFTTAALIFTPLTVPDIAIFTNGSDRAENSTAMYSKLEPLGSSCLHSGEDVSLCNSLYVLQALQLLTTCTGNLGTDLFLYSLAFHLCGQFEILGNDMMQLGKIEDASVGRKDMRKIIERHYLLLDLAEGLEITARIMLLVQLFLNGLQICMIGFQLIESIKHHNFSLMMRLISEYLVLLMQLYLYCYMGESLSSKVEELTNAIYQSDWFNLPSSMVKDCSFVIARGRIPFRITAGSFYPMNFGSFTNITKAAASYMSVLQLMFED